jgi:hypothetical protein
VNSKINEKENAMIEGTRESQVYRPKFVASAAEVRDFRLDEAIDAYVDDHLTPEELAQEERWISFKYYKSLFSFGLL